MAVVGLTEYGALRDFLYTQMRGARFGETGDRAAAAEDRPAVTESDDAVVLLTDIRDEIRSLRAALQHERES